MISRIENDNAKAWRITAWNFATISSCFRDLSLDFLQIPREYFNESIVSKKKMQKQYSKNFFFLQRLYIYLFILFNGVSTLASTTISDSIELIVQTL